MSDFRAPFAIGAIIRAMRPLQLGATLSYAAAGLWTLYMGYRALSVAYFFNEATTSGTPGENVAGMVFTAGVAPLAGIMLFFQWLLPVAFFLILALVLRSADKKRQTP